MKDAQFHRLQAAKKEIGAQLERQGFGFVERVNLLMQMLAEHLGPLDRKSRKSALATFRDLVAKCTRQPEKQGS